MKGNKIWLPPDLSKLLNETSNTFCHPSGLLYAVTISAIWVRGTISEQHLNFSCACYFWKVLIFTPNNFTHTPSLDTCGIWNLKNCSKQIVFWSSSPQITKFSKAASDILFLIFPPVNFLVAMQVLEMYLSLLNSSVLSEPLSFPFNRACQNVNEDSPSSA